MTNCKLIANEDQRARTNFKVRIEVDSEEEAFEAAKQLRNNVSMPGAQNWIDKLANIFEGK